MNMLLLTAADFLDRERVRITGRRFRQMQEIIGLEIGKEFRAGMENGLMGKAEVSAFDDSSADLKVKLDTPPPAPLPVTLICALPRPLTLQKVLHGAITLGVKQIHLIHARKVEKSFWQSSALKPENLTENIQLALEQCGDTIPPELIFHQRFKPFIEDVLPALLAAHNRGIFGHPRAKIPVPQSPSGSSLLAVGPEGGFTDYENQMLEQCGMTPVTLGPRVLRTEYAVTALLSKLS